MQARIPQALVRGAGEPAGERRGALDRLAAAAREGQALRAAPFPLDGRGAPVPGPRRPAGHLARVRRGARRQAHLRQQLLHRSRGQRGQRGADRARRPGALEDRERGLQLPGAARPQLQAQLRARQGRAGQRAGRAEPVRLRAPRRGAVRLRAAAAVPAPAGHAPRPVPGAAGRAALVPLPGPADAAGGGARRTRASGLPGGRGLDSARPGLRAVSCRQRPASGRPSQPATAGGRPAAGSALGGPATRAAPRPCPPSDAPAGRPRERNLSVNLFTSSSETTFTHPLDGQI